MDTRPSARGIRSRVCASGVQRDLQFLDVLREAASKRLNSELTAFGSTFTPFVNEALERATGSPVAGFDGKGDFPPGPDSDFGVGHALQFNDDPIGFLEHLGSYGDVSGCRFGTMPAVLLNEAKLAEMYYADTDLFCKRRVVDGESKAAAEQTRSLVGNGLVSSEGELWKKQRRLMNPGFDHSRVSSYGDTFVEYTERIVGEWKVGGAGVGKRVVDIQEEMMQLTMEIACKTLFDADVRGASSSLGEAVTKCFAASNDPTRRVLFFIPQWLPTPAELEFDISYKEISQYLTSLVRERRATGNTDTGDLLSLLMQARDEETGEGMSEQQLLDEMMTLFVAGHETTALTLTWSLILLSQHPEIEEKVREELAEVVGDRSATAADMPALKYTTAVIAETLRLYPSVFLIARATSRPTTIDGWNLPADTFAMVSPWLMHRDARYFENPESFDPNRWLDGTLKKSLPSGVYQPFGGGKRTCIGMGFANMEATLCLATILQNCDLKLVVPSEESLRPTPNVTLRAKGPVSMEVS